MAVETVNAPMPGADPALAAGGAPGAPGKALAAAQPVAEGQGAAPPGGPQQGSNEPVKAPEGEAPKALSELTATPPEPVKPEPQKAVEAATGLDLTKFSDEFATAGKLSDASYTELEGKGLSRVTVDTYIAGLQAQQEQRSAALSQIVGGADAFNSIIEWGKTALGEAEKIEAVKVLSGNSVDAARTYLAGLQARFVKENGKAPGKMSGGGSGPAPDVYADRQEQAKAIGDPRYSRDPQYRREVMEKSKRSFAPVKKRAKTAAKKAARPTTSRRAWAKGRTR